MDDTQTTSTIIECQADEEGNLVLEFPDGLLEMVGWEEGDDLSLEAIADRIIIRKIEKTV